MNHARGHRTSGFFLSLLDEISANVAPGAHAVVIPDRAGWHHQQAADPNNCPYPCRPLARAELPKDVWQFLRQRFLSNRIFQTYDDIVDAVL